MYLIRAVDATNTVEFYLSRSTRHCGGKAFFRKALKHHREPHSITMDGPSRAKRARTHGNERGVQLPKPLTIRCCQYLNNVVEQDHRRVKGRLRPMLGFKTFYNARRVIIGPRTGAEDSQTPVRNSDPMAVESRGDLASRHGRIVRIAAVHS